MLNSCHFPIYFAASTVNAPATEDAGATIFFYSLAAIVLFIGLWNLLIAILGLFPIFHATAVGTLTKANTQKNVRTRHGHLLPRLTQYAYTYTVKGKHYRHSRQMQYSKRRLLPKASLVYVKWFPRHAYVNKFTGEVEWAMGISMLCIACLFLYVLAAS